MDWLYPLSGFVVGAIVGLTGMGGGSLMTPLLILLFGVHPLTAVGTDLLYAAVTKTAGTAIHSKKGNVDWRVAGLLAAGSVPATVLTIWVLSRVPKQSPTTATIISVSMGVILIIAAVAIYMRTIPVVNAPLTSATGLQLLPRIVPFHQGLGLPPLNALVDEIVTTLDGFFLR